MSENSKAKNLSRLSRIRLSPEEEITLDENIQTILNYMLQIQEINTDETPICTNVLPLSETVFEEDNVINSYDRETFLENAPDLVGGMLKVPPVIEGDA